jgi:hypothetical protein
VTSRLGIGKLLTFFYSVRILINYSVFSGPYSYGCYNRRAQGKVEVEATGEGVIKQGLLIGCQEMGGGGEGGGEEYEK